jgi:hypothetical protein
MNTRLGQLVDDILHHRSSADRQHFFGLTLRGGKQASSMASHWYDSNINHLIHSLADFIGVRSAALSGWSGNRNIAILPPRQQVKN